MALNPFRRNKINSFHQPAAPNRQDQNPQAAPAVAGVAPQDSSQMSSSVPQAGIINDISPLPAAMPPEVPGASYAAFPDVPSYGAFPEPAPSYGGFPQPDPVGPPAVATYDGFPQPVPASYIGFPPSPDPSGPPAPTYSGFPVVTEEFQHKIDVANAKSQDMMSMPEPAYSGFPASGGTVAAAEPSYDGFPQVPTYSAFPEPGDMPAVGDQFHRSESGGTTVAYNDQMKPEASAPAATVNDAAAAQPQSSVFNPPDPAVAAAKSEDMMSTAPTLPAPSAPAPEVPHAMVSADLKMEQSAAPVAPDNVGAVAAGTSPTVTPPVFQTQVDTANFKSNDMMSTDVTLPVAPPPAEAPPAQPFSALDPTSNIHHPGAQIE